MAAGPTSGQLEGPGGTRVPTWGVIALGLYLVAFTLLLITALVQVWQQAPESSVSITVARPGMTAGERGDGGGPPPTQPEDAGRLEKSTKSGVVTPIKLRVLGQGFTTTNEVRMMLIVLLAGALGAALHAIRSFWWYTGNRVLTWSWTWMYMLLPFSGSILALILFFAVRGGAATAPETLQSGPHGVAAVAALVGLFSREALQKLRQVAETIFAKAEAGKDQAKPAPTLAQVAPASGPVAGGTLVELRGRGFTQGATVTFGGIAATGVSWVSASQVKATTPAHAQGDVDVVLTNSDHQAATLANGYKYT